jgi:hypothetical protein
MKYNLNSIKAPTQFGVDFPTLKLVKLSEVDSSALNRFKKSKHIDGMVDAILEHGFCDVLKVLPKKDGEEKHEIVEADHRRGSLWKIAFENMSDDMIVPIAILDWKSSHDTEEVLATITSLNNNSLPWKLFDYCKAFSHPSLKGKTSKAIFDSYVEVFNRMKELGQARRVILTNGQVAQIYTSEFSGFEDMYKGRFQIDIDREEYTKAMLDRIPTLITKLGKKNFPGAFLRRYLFLLGDKCGTPGGVTSRDWWKGNKDSFAKWETFFGKTIAAITKHIANDYDDNGTLKTPEDKLLPTHEKAINAWFEKIS